MDKKEMDVAPEVEVLEVEVEKGFQASGEGPTVDVDEDALPF